MTGPYGLSITDAGGNAQPTAVRISSTSQRIRVFAEDRHDVAVEGNAVTSRAGSLESIEAVDKPLTVRVPQGFDVQIGSVSAKVTVAGAVGVVAVLTDSGRISIDTATSVDARTDSAKVTIRHAAGLCRVRTETGQVRVDACGGADVATNSGRITLGQVTGPVKAHCVSGRIDVAMNTAHDVDAETVSGRVQVVLPAGVQAWQPSEPGRTSATPDGFDCTINVRSVSGRVDVSSK